MASEEKRNLVDVLMIPDHECVEWIPRVDTHTGDAQLFLEETLKLAPLEHLSLSSRFSIHVPKDCVFRITATSRLRARGVVVRAKGIGHGGMFNYTLYNENVRTCVLLPVGECFATLQLWQHVSTILWEQYTLLLCGIYMHHSCLLTVLTCL